MGKPLAVERYKDAKPLTKDQYAAMFRKYLDLARQIGWKLTKKYGYHHLDLVAEAESVLAESIMTKGHLIACVPAAETTCIYRLVSWKLLTLIQRPNQLHKHERIHPNMRRNKYKDIPDKKKEEIFWDLPQELHDIVTKILEEPDEFKCRPNVLKYSSTPICKHLVRKGMPQHKAVGIQKRLEEHFV